MDLRRRLLLGTTLSMGALSLSACGGGGATGGSSGLTSYGLGLSLLFSPSTFETVEYGVSGALAQTNASSAYGVGATGSGMVVAVIDTGIDTTHAELVSHVHPDSTDIIGGRGALQDVGNHGTPVSGVIAADRNANGMHGMAYNSQIMAIRADSAGSCSVGSSGSCTFDQTDLATATDYAVSHNADILNYSLGNALSLNSAFQGSLANAAGSGHVLVFAAGNNGSSSPDYPGAFASSSEAQGRAIVVGSVDASNTISAFSNRAGSSKNAYMVAPGENIVSTTSASAGGGYSAYDGTSLAAPSVSGAAALVWQAAPSLSADEVVSILLNTATDLGQAGVDSTYGHGLLNLKAALAPQGTLTLSLGNRVDGHELAAADSRMTLPAMMTGAPELGQSLMLLDAYDRSYSVLLENFVERRSSPLDIARWIDSDHEFDKEERILDGRVAFQARPASERDNGDLALRAQLQPGTMLDIAIGRPMDAASVTRPLPSAGFAELSQGASMAIGHQLGYGFEWRMGFSTAIVDTQRSDLDGADRTDISSELVHRSASGATARLSLGQLDESDGPFGMESAGALAFGDGSRTVHGRISIDQPITSDLSLFAEAMLARTTVSSTATGLVRDVGNFRSDGYALGLASRNLLRDADRFAVTLMQPLRPDGLEASLDLPVARTLDGTVIRRRHDVRLSGDGREIDLALDYRLPLHDGRTVLRLGGILRHEADHDPARDLDFVSLFGLTHRF
ncbi:MAG: S8 family serine peptidase [Geminicoccaceae bacterium]|nr:S8 family serine peptidase [Geminicoccaceae bacterium]